MSQHHYAILEEVAGYIAIARAKNRVTDGDTPQIIAAHPRVPQFVLEKVRISLIRLQESQQGRQMLSTMKEKGFQVTEDGAGDDEGPQKSALPE